VRLAMCYVLLWKEKHTLYHHVLSDSFTSRLSNWIHVNCWFIQNVNPICLFNLIAAEFLRSNICVLNECNIHGAPRIFSLILDSLNSQKVLPSALV
jgi:hypothetical protein